MHESNEHIRTVSIESPFAGNVKRNNAYLNLCILDCLLRGETPYASHRMLTSALDDNNPEERSIGIKAGLKMSSSMDERVFYIDLGISGGMSKAREYYDSEGMSYEDRTLGTHVIYNMDRELQNNASIGIVKIRKIDVLKRAHRPDVLFIHSHLPEGTHPYAGTAVLKMDVAQGRGDAYCNRHFGGVPMNSVFEDKIVSSHPRDFLIVDDFVDDRRLTPEEMEKIKKWFEKRNAKRDSLHYDPSVDEEMGE